MPSDLKYDIARFTGIPSFFHWLNRNRILVLAYHGIYDGPKKDGALPETFVHVEDMTLQLKYIKRMYHVVSPESVLESFENKNPLPPNSVLITFDDGYESFFRLAAPVLKVLEIKPIVFISTRYMDRNEPFWFDMLWLFASHASLEDMESLCDLLGIDNMGEVAQVKKKIFSEVKGLSTNKRDEIIEPLITKLQARNGNLSSDTSHFYPLTYDQARYLSEKNGVYLGGHTHSHTILTSITPHEVAEEIRVNKEKIEESINTPCLFFAYPNGSEKDFNNIHKEILSNAGYRAAFSLTQRRSQIYKDPFDISRIHIAPEDTVNSLNIRFAGMSPYIKKIKKYLFQKY